MNWGFGVLGFWGFEGITADIRGFKGIEGITAYISGLGHHGAYKWIRGI